MWSRQTGTHPTHTQKPCPTEEFIIPDLSLCWMSQQPCGSGWGSSAVIKSEHPLMLWLLTLIYLAHACTATAAGAPATWIIPWVTAIPASVSHCSTLQWSDGALNLHADFLPRWAEPLVNFFVCLHVLVFYKPVMQTNTVYGRNIWTPCWWAN